MSGLEMEIGSGFDDGNVDGIGGNFPVNSRILTDVEILDRIDSMCRKLYVEFSRLGLGLYDIKDLPVSDTQIFKRIQDVQKILYDVRDDMIFIRDGAFGKDREGED